MRPLFILGLILSILIIVFSIIFFKKDKISIKGFVFWIIFSICVGVVSILPGILDSLLKLFFINPEARGFSVLTIAIFIIFIIIYNQSISQKKIQRAVAKLVQEMAILNYKFDKNIDSKEKNNEKEKSHLDD